MGEALAQDSAQRPSTKTWHAPAQCSMTNTMCTALHDWLQNRPNWQPRQEDSLCQIQEMVGSSPNRGCYHLSDGSKQYINDMSAMAMLSTRMANRLPQDTGQLTHSHTSLMLKQLEPGNVSNTPSACLHTSDSAAYGSALTAPQSSGACMAMPQTHHSGPFTTAKM